MDKLNIITSLQHNWKSMTLVHNEKIKKEKNFLKTFSTEFQVLEPSHLLVYV